MSISMTSNPLQPDGCKMSVLLTFTYAREKWVIKMSCESSYSHFCLLVKVGGVFDEENRVTWTDSMQIWHL